MTPIRFLTIPTVLLFLAPSLSATLIDFEDLNDSDTVGNHYAPLGVTFTNAVVLTAGVNLGEAEFPPHSGVNVAADLNGPITLQFSSLVTSISGFFTYASALTMTAFDSSSTPVLTATSLFSANFVSSGNPPNEFIQINYALGIDHVTIVGDPGGNSFVVDDISFAARVVSGVPEPGSFYLSGLVLFSLSVWQFWRRFLAKSI